MYNATGVILMPTVIPYLMQISFSPLDDATQYTCSLGFGNITCPY